MSTGTTCILLIVLQPHVKRSLSAVYSDVTSLITLYMKHNYKTTRGVSCTVDISHSLLGHTATEFCYFI